MSIHDVDPDTGWSIDRYWYTRVFTDPSISPYINNGPILDGSDFKNPSVSLSNFRWAGGDWWDKHRLVSKFVNKQDIPLRITSLGVLASPCSTQFPAPIGLKWFMTSGGGKAQAKGYGCKFSVDIVLDTGEVYPGVGDGTMKAINQYNCFTGYAGGTNEYDANGTGFGKPIFYGEGTPLEFDSLGNPRGWKHHTVTFIDAPTVQPGQGMYVVLRRVDWVDINGNRPSDANTYGYFELPPEPNYFTSEFESGPRGYVWKYVANREEDEDESVPNAPHWKKITRVFKYTANGWEVQGDQFEDKKKG